jgi:hypothetical protein
MRRSASGPVLLIATVAIVMLGIWASGAISTVVTPTARPTASLGPPSSTPVQTEDNASATPPSGSSALPSGSSAPPADTSSQAATQPPIPTLTPRPDISIGPPEANRTASDLTGEARCSKAFIGVAEADLRWTPASPPGERQLVEVSIFAFEPGKSAFSEPLGPTDGHVVTGAVFGQAIHEWRVLTRLGDTWTPSEPAEFEGVTCTFQ